MRNKVGCDGLRPYRAFTFRASEYGFSPLRSIRAAKFFISFMSPVFANE